MELKRNYNELIKEILSRNNIDKNTVLGVLIYGSTITGYDDDFSDIDILLVTADDSKQEARGVLISLDKRVEYFIISETNVYKELFRELDTVSPALIMAFVTGIIYYEKNSIMQQLKKRAQDILKMPYVKLSLNEIRIKTNILRNHLKELKRKYLKKSPDYSFCYFNYVNELITFYARYKGITIKDCKLYELLTDETYRERFYIKNHFSIYEEKIIIKMITKVISIEEVIKHSDYIFEKLGCGSEEFIIKLTT